MAKAAEPTGIVTSRVVVAGMLLLAVLGVVTVFGESVLAVAVPPSPSPSEAASLGQTRQAP